MQDPVTRNRDSVFMMTANDIEKAMSGTRHRPYNIEARLRMADAYQEQGYPDLALGEAYLGLLLIDEVRDESGEWHDDALEDMRRAAHADVNLDQTTEDPTVDEDDADEEFSLTIAESHWLQQQEIKV